MVSFISRLKTFVFCYLIIAVIALIAVFYFSLRYSFTSRLDIKYSGMLNLKIDKDVVEFNVASTNSSHKNYSIQASDKVYLLQKSSRSKQSEQMIKTRVIVTDNKNDRNRTSDNSLMNHAADGSVASHDNHKQNVPIIHVAKAGVASDGSNTVQDLQESLCPKNPSTLGESRFFNILVCFKVHLINCFQSPLSNQNGRRSVKSVNYNLHMQIQMQNEIKIILRSSQNIFISIILIIALKHTDSFTVYLTWEMKPNA